MSGINSVELKALESAFAAAIEKMNQNVKQAQDAAVAALEESKKLGGTIEGKTNDRLKEIDDQRVKVQEDVVAIRQQIVDLAQKMNTRPGGSGDEYKTIHEMLVESDQFKDSQKRGPSAKSMDPVVVGSFHRHLAMMTGKTAIFNATLNNDQPLVSAHRVPGIFATPDQRLYVRDLLPSSVTDTNLIEFTSETAFTNNAAPQGSGSSPTETEGQIKAESGITFTLANSPVITIAHWIPASRQVLADAKLLQGHINARLLYGLKLEEEEELLLGTGAAGTLNGLVNQATAYSRGQSNDTMLDTVLKSILQVSLSNYEASGVVMHPVDWFSAMLLKDTLGRYLFSDPQAMVQPRLWAKPVVASMTMTQGKFMTGAFNMGAQIWDREDATIRVSENVNDHFIRNMVAILAEERLAFTVYRPLAFIYGNLIG